MLASTDTGVLRQDCHLSSRFKSGLAPYNGGMMMRAFQFEIGQLVVTKSELAVTRGHYAATGVFVQIRPVQIVGRYWFESAQTTEQVYHTIENGQVVRHLVDELADAQDLFSLWMELDGKEKP